MEKCLDDPSTHANRRWQFAGLNLWRWSVLVAIAALPLAFVLARYGATWLLRRAAHSLIVPWPLTVLAGVIAALAIFGAVWHIQVRWRRPLRRLTNCLQAIRAGQAPIDELVSVDGELAVLTPLLREMLHELRGQEKENALLRSEMHQRICIRTDALERSIGALRQQAARDALSGLYNRRMFDQCLGEVIERCQKQELDLALLMVDIDDFKILNDTLGHPAGDALLRDISMIIRSGIRESDMAFRYGGDEFVILLPGCPEAEAQQLCRRLSETVDGLAKPLAVLRKPRLCVGICNLSELDEQSGRVLLKTADQRLYALKQARKSARAA